MSPFIEKILQIFKSKKNKQKLYSKPVFIVKITKDTIVCKRPDNKIESVDWNDLGKIEMRTILLGPNVLDAFWVLHGKKQLCVIPKGAVGEDKLIESFTKIPGFDKEILIEAMASTDDSSFEMWTKDSKKGYEALLKEESIKKNDFDVRIKKHKGDGDIYNDSDFIIKINKKGLTCARPDKKIESILWQDMNKIEIRIFLLSPSVIDIFWLLTGDNEVCAIPHGSVGEDKMLKVFQKLSGFNKKTYIDAIKFNDDGIFDLWQRKVEN